MAVGVVEHPVRYDRLEAMVADRTPKPQKPGPKVGTKYRPRKPAAAPGPQEVRE